jgi:hypothetical protein
MSESKNVTMGDVRLWSNEVWAMVSLDDRDRCAMLLTQMMDGAYFVGLRVGLSLANDASVKP